PEIATAFAFLAERARRGVFMKNPKFARTDDDADVDADRTAEILTDEETALLAADTWDKRAMIVHSFVCDLRRRGFELFGHVSFHARWFGPGVRGCPPLDEGDTEEDDTTDEECNAEEDTTDEECSAEEAKQQEIRLMRAKPHLQLFDLPLTASDICSCLLIEV